MMYYFFYICYWVWFANILLRIFPSSSSRPLLCISAGSWAKDSFLLLAHCHIDSFAFYSFLSIKVCLSATGGGSVSCLPLRVDCGYVTWWKACLYVGVGQIGSAPPTLPSSTQLLLYSSLSGRETFLGPWVWEAFLHLLSWLKAFASC